MKFPPTECDVLAHRLFANLHGESEDTPEAIAKAWDEEIARRVVDMEAGRTKWIPADEVMCDIRARIAVAKADTDQPQR